MRGTIMIVVSTNRCVHVKSPALVGVSHCVGYVARRYASHVVPTFQYLLRTISLYGTFYIEWC